MTSDSGCMLASVYIGCWCIFSCVKVDSDPACRCATTGARGPYAALVVNNGGMAGFAGSDASCAVLAFPAVFP